MRLGKNGESMGEKMMCVSDVAINNCDCLIGLKDVASASVDLIIADPPYGIDFQSARIADKSRRMRKIANDKTPFVWWLYDAARVLKDTGSLVCFARWDVQEFFCRMHQGGWTQSAKRVRMV